MLLLRGFAPQIALFLRLGPSLLESFGGEVGEQRLHTLINLNSVEFPCPHEHFPIVAYHKHTSVWDAKRRLFFEDKAWYPILLEYKLEIVHLDCAHEVESGPTLVDDASLQIGGSRGLRQLKLVYLRGVLLQNVVLRESLGEKIWRRVVAKCGRRFQQVRIATLKVHVLPRREGTRIIQSIHFLAKQFLHLAALLP